MRACAGRKRYGGRRGVANSVVIGAGALGQPASPGSARLTDQLTPKIQELTRALEEIVEKDKAAPTHRTAIRSRAADGLSIQTRHWNPRAFLLRQAIFLESEDCSPE